MVLGILAGASAAGITLLAYSKLSETLMQDTTLWTAMGITGLIPLKSIMWKIVIAYIAAGAIVSAIGTVMSTSKYVKI